MILMASGHSSDVSFPGLGIGEFQVNSEAFSVFGHSVMWYGVIICIGVLLGFAYFAYRAKQKGIKFDDVLDYTLAAVPTAVVGARLYFVIFFGGVKSFYDLIAIWEGGLAIYGAIIGGAVAVILVARHKKQSFFKLADMIVPAVMIGQILGRWGNFMNGEAYGAIATADNPLYFLRMGLRNTDTFLTFGTVDTVFVHPTFLYESLWNVIGFVLINIFYKKKKYNGEVFLWYFGWYGLGRGFIEMLRMDSLYIGSIRVSSMLGFLFAAVCIPLLIVLRINLKKCNKENVFASEEPSIMNLLFPKLRKAPVVCDTGAHSDAEEINADTEACAVTESEEEKTEKFEEMHTTLDATEDEKKIRIPIKKKIHVEQSDENKEDKKDNKNGNNN